MPSSGLLTSLPVRVLIQGLPPATTRGTGGGRRRGKEGRKREREKEGKGEERRK
jgi:hypothetical protein